MRMKKYYFELGENLDSHMAAFSDTRPLHIWYWAAPCGWKSRWHWWTKTWVCLLGKKKNKYPNSSTSSPFLLALPATVFLCLQGMNNVPARAMYRQTLPSVSHIMHEITSSQRHSAQTQSALVQLPPRFGTILHCHPPLINPWWPAADGTSDCLSEGLTGRSCGEGSGWAKKEEEWGGGRGQ